MLSAKAKYAFKAMFALARLEPGALLQARDISEKETISKKFLDLILLELRGHGLVRSFRGQHGGYSLAKAPGEITLGQIVRIIDGPLAPIACASVTAYRRCDDCKNEQECLVRQSMRRVRDAASEILDHTTLASALAMEKARKTRKRKAA
ncbi:MAG TPA: Rrf2 family transcriptional regulator [Bradyrhizobium sp.]|jgi:Rrf2 family protein